MKKAYLMPSKRRTKQWHIVDYGCIEVQHNNQLLGVKDTNWFITPAIKEEFCSSVVYDGRRRFVVLSNIHETWYVHTNNL